MDIRIKLRIFLLGAATILLGANPLLGDIAGHDPFLARDQKKSAANFCEAGGCMAFGLSFSCGVIRCNMGENCGCSCVIESGAAYPKAYCGDDDPYASLLREDERGEILDKRSRQEEEKDPRAQFRPVVTSK